MHPAVATSRPQPNGGPEGRHVTIDDKNKTLELTVFSLGIEKSGKKGFQLALYGKDSSPVLRVPLTAATFTATPYTAWRFPAVITSSGVP